MTAGAGGAAGRADGWPGPAVLAGRFAAQLLTGEPGRSAVDVTRRLLAVQGQDPRGARLAIRARSAGLCAADIDRALTAERSLLITWLNRGTLHLVCSEDYWWLHPLTTPPLFTASARRLAQEGVPPGDADRAVAVIEASLAADGPLTRAQLAERITAAGVRTEGQALVHILLLASPARPYRARADDRRAARLRAGQGLAGRTARGVRPGHRAGRAGPPLPGRAWPGRRS